MEKLSSVASDLWPYLLPRIEKLVQMGAGGGGGSVVSGAPTPHAISSTHHSGTLADSQGPQFLKIDGTRALVGNLSVSSGITIDGVDLSAHAASASSHHAPVTAGDGIDLSGQQVSVDVTDIIDTAYGLTESSNNIRVFLATAGSGLEFSGGGLRIASGWAGAGLTLSGSWTLDVGQGAGLTVSADAVALTTPGSLSVSSTNTAAGSHTHAVTASSDVSAGVAALLKSTAAGGLGLASAFTTGAVDVGQGFTAGNTGFRVIYHTHDYPHTHVVVNPTGGWNLDEQFGLDVDDNLLVRGWIVGKHAIQLAGATMLTHYDGPGPFETNFTGNPTGHMGQVGTPSGTVIYREGRFGKAVQIAGATVNLFGNPSFEVNATTNLSHTTDGGTIASDAGQAHVGMYAAKMTRTGAGTLQMRSGTVATLANGETLYYSAWAFAVAVGDAQVQIYNLTGGAAVAAAQNTTVDAWELLQISWTNSTGSNADVRVHLNNVAAANNALWFDEVQVTTGAAMPYVDGSLNDSISWSGTAHGSASTSTAARLSYPASGIFDVNTGTVMAWVKVADVADTATRYVVYHYNAAGRIWLLRSNGTWWYRVGAASTRDSGAAVTAGWHLIAMTWARGVMAFLLDGVAIDATSYTPVELTLSTSFDVGSDGAGSTHLNGWIDELSILSRAMTEDEIRAVYESNAPVFAETSTWHWRAGRNRFWADSEGIWMYGASGGAILGAYAGDDLDPAATKSWGGLSLSEGDLLIGRSAGGYLHWDNSAETLAVKGSIIITGGSGYAALSDKPTLGTLAAKNTADFSTDVSGATKPADNATVGATWGTNLYSIPTTLGAPSGTGLFLSSTYMGYYTSSVWKTYINNVGDMILGDVAGGGAGLAWNQAAATLSIRGSIIITGGSGYAALTDKPTLGSLAAKNSVDLATGEVTNKSLANVDSTANTKLSGIAAGATVGATWGTNLYSIPAPLGATSGAGLYLNASQMGYWNGSAWRTYMDSTGKFYFGGASGATIAWDGTDLFGTDGTTVQWYARASTGKLYAGAGDVTLSADGVNLLSDSVDYGHNENYIKWRESLPSGTIWAYIGHGFDTTAIGDLRINGSGIKNTAPEIRMRYDDSIGTGYNYIDINAAQVLTNGHIAMGSGGALRTNLITAYYPGTLSIEDDGGNTALTVNDGGTLTLGVVANVIDAKGYRSGFTGTIADDAAVALSGLPSRGIITLFTGTTMSETAMVVYRAEATALTLLFVTGGQAVVTTGALTGTTSTDGKFTVSAHTDGKVYVENRRGGSRGWHYMIMGSS